MCTQEGGEGGGGTPVGRRYGKRGLLEDNGERFAHKAALAVRMEEEEGTKQRKKGVTKHRKKGVHRKRQCTCARMIRSMLADQPYLEVTTTQGVLARRVLIFTFSTSGSASAAFHQVTTPLNSSCNHRGQAR